MADKLSFVLKTDDICGNTCNPDGSESISAIAHKISKTVLLGKIISSRGYGVSFIMPILEKLWGCVGRLKVISKGYNLFLFVFEKEAELNRVITHAPWFLANAYLVVKRWPPTMTWEQIDLSKSCIWVHVIGLPLPQLNKENATRIGDAFAGFLDYEISKVDVLNTSPVMKIKVEFWVDKPLLTGFNNIISEEHQPWVRFQYEHLTEFCWFCGRLGHILPRCSYRKEDEMPPVYDMPEKGYGYWLEAPVPENRLYAPEPLIDPV
ncbi:hypothetical protein Tsubulata_010014 [Turnera subulata]|uniref:CCHC-type domain-containing protein n=1 Tax=Turnera subulata TaxID=218843 RepID=A0A9Q0FSU9_9ROSI|nr:hypothetical protein Tsubulata_010014 [Turnera subulata]